MRRLSLVTALLVLIGGTAIMTPTWAATSEQQGHHGANTFTNYHNASGMGQRVDPAQWVDVSCKVYDPYIESVNPDGYWYRLASNPWNDEYYAAANTFMNGDPWDGPYSHNTDFNVPDCGRPSEPSPTPSPSRSPSRTQPAQKPRVSLARGPIASQGYRYAISLTNFEPNSSASINCRDSVSPGGFFTFSMSTGGDGSAFTKHQCYSGDGPDHWVVVNGNIESNHVSWGSDITRSDAATPATSPPTVLEPSTPQPIQRERSVFYSGTDTATGIPDVNPADQNLSFSRWKSTGHNCTSTNAVESIDFGVGTPSTLSGWSKGRLGVIYYLAGAGEQKVAQVHRIVLFDPGSTADFTRSTWDQLFGIPACDQNYDINSLLANWLRSDSANHLLVFTGHDSEEKRDGEPKYSGLWRYYFAGIWNQPFADRALVCNYDDMEHEEVLRRFYREVKSSSFDCPDGPGRTHPWNP